MQQAGLFIFCMLSSRPKTGILERWGEDPTGKKFWEKQKNNADRGRQGFPVLCNFLPLSAECMSLSSAKPECSGAHGRDQLLMIINSNSF